MIGTSISITHDRLAGLQMAVKKMNLSESELLSILLWKSRRLFGDEAVTGKTVDYQHNDGESDFVVHHINISETDYEFATGRRYIFKISVSFIFALAIDLFLSAIIHEWTEKRLRSEKDWKRHCTNYYSNHFHIDHFINDIAEFWLIPWLRE